MARLYLVRHGAAEGVAGRVTGQRDVALSRAGAEAVLRLGARWRGDPPQRLDSSDLARGAASAAILGRRWGIPVTPDPRLREMDFGRWEGRTWQEIHREDGARLEEWGGRWWEGRAPGGEGFQDVTRRVLAWFDERLVSPGAPAVTVAVLHAGSLRALLVGLGCIPREAAWDLRLDPARVTALEVSRCGTVKLLFLNRKGWWTREESVQRNSILVEPIEIEPTTS